MTKERGRGAAVVPAISTQSSTVSVRSLGRAGITPIAATDGQRSPALSSNHCAEVVHVTDPKDSMTEYAEGLLELARREDVHTILPLREADAYALSMNRQAFDDHLDPVWPDFETLRSAQDRRTLISVADGLGIPTPSTRMLTNWRREDGPLVVKPRYSIVVGDDGSAAREPSVRTLDSSERPSIESIVDEMGHVPLVQTYVPNGGEYGFFALMNEGDPVLTFQHRRIRSGSYSGGASVYRESVDIPELDAYGSALLSELDWHGPAMVEFRRDARDGSFVLMEINPRFWGSLALPVHAGIDFPRHYFELSLGERPTSAEAEYDTGVGSHLLSGELAYLFNVLRGNGFGDPPPLGREVVSVLRSVHRNPQFDLLSVEDPAPFVHNVAGMAKLFGSWVVDEIPP